MRTFLFTLLAFVMTAFTSAPKSQDHALPFQAGEYFKFKISYSKFIGAGYATLNLTETMYENKPVFFAKGYGANTGISRILFKVQDNYSSYFDTKTIQPYLSIRDIREGSYTKKQNTYFNHQSKTAVLKDLEKNTEKTYSVPTNVQDVISTFYYLRNHKEIDKIAVGESIEIDMFFDDEIFKFKLKYLGKEIIKTKFGKVSTMKFRPMVQAGRVFKEKESLTVWVSDDKNKAPLQIKANLAVGFIIAELNEYKGLKYPLNKQ